MSSLAHLGALGNSCLARSSRAPQPAALQVRTPAVTARAQRPATVGVQRSGQTTHGFVSLRRRSPSLPAAAAAATERQSSPTTSKEINEELKVCEFSDDVLDIVEDEAGNFNNVNAATALLRVARISGNVPHAARQDLLRDSRFLKLMGLVQYHASGMRPRELCSILQSMVYLRYQCRDTLAAVTAASEASIGRFNERDVSSMIWSLASLKVKKLPPRLMVQLVALGVDKIEDMAPQGISMMLWGLATLEVTPKQALLDKATIQIKRRIEDFAEKPQALTNSLWGLAKMNYFPRAALVATMRLLKGSSSARARLQKANRPQEVINLFWVFARCNTDPGEQLFRLADTYVAEHVDRLTAFDISNIVWVYATLGHTPADALLGRLGAEAITKADTFSVSSAINFIWAMTLLGCENHPALPKLLSLVETGNANDGLDESQARQMFQAHLLAEKGEASWTPSTDLRTAGALQWITSLTRGQVRNHFAMHQLSAELRAMGITHEMMHATPDKVLRADLAMKTVSGDWLAIRVLRRNRDHVRNGLRQTGPYLAWKKLMQARDYTVLELYEQEIVDFVESGTGPEVLSSLLEPYEFEKVEAPVVMAPVEAQGEAVVLSSEAEETLRQQASASAPDEWEHGA